MEKSLAPSPALKKDISDIIKDDVKVQILGTVVDYITTDDEDTRSLNQLIISDGTDSIKVFLDENTDRNFKVKEKVRVFGTPIINDENKFDISAEIIQDMNSLNIDLYNQIRKLRAKNKKK